MALSKSNNPLSHREASAEWEKTKREAEKKAPERVEMFEVSLLPEVDHHDAIEWTNYNSGLALGFCTMKSATIPPGKWRVVLERVEE